MRRGFLQHQQASRLNDTLRLKEIWGLIYRRTKEFQGVQLLLGHSKLESTVRYLGVEVDDALEMAEQTEV